MAISQSKLNTKSNYLPPPVSFTILQAIKNHLKIRHKISIPHRNKKKVDSSRIKQIQT